MVQIIWYNSLASCRFQHLSQQGFGFRIIELQRDLHGPKWNVVERRPRNLDEILLSRDQTLHLHRSGPISNLMEILCLVRMVIGINSKVNIWDGDTATGECSSKPHRVSNSAERRDVFLPKRLNRSHFTATVDQTGRLEGTHQYRHGGPTSNCRQDRLSGFLVHLIAPCHQHTTGPAQ